MSNLDWLIEFNWIERISVCACVLVFLKFHKWSPVSKAHRQTQINENRGNGKPSTRHFERKHESNTLASKKGKCAGELLCSENVVKPSNWWCHLGFDRIILDKGWFICYVSSCHESATVKHSSFIRHVTHSTYHFSFSTILSMPTVFQLSCIATVAVPFRLYFDRQSEATLLRGDKNQLFIFEFSAYIFDQIKRYLYLKFPDLSDFQIELN